MTPLEEKMERNFDPSDTDAASALAGASLRLVRSLAKRKYICPHDPNTGDRAVLENYREVCERLGLLRELDTEPTYKELLEMIERDVEQ
jgi:hypothetical protein